MGDILEIESGVTLVFNGSGNIGSGSLVIIGETINHGTINMNGGDGSNSGKISIVEGEGIVTNHGTINLNGGDGLGSAPTPTRSPQVGALGTRALRANAAAKCPAYIGSTPSPFSAFSDRARPGSERAAERTRERKLRDRFQSCRPPF